MGIDRAAGAACGRTLSRSPMAPAASTRERTHATVARLAREGDVKPAAHLTCVAASRREIDAIVQGYWDVGVRHIVALRGDPQEGLGAKFWPHPDGYANSLRPRRRHQAHRRFRNLGLGLPRRPSRKPLARRRHRCAEGQDRRGRQSRDHAILFRERDLSALSRQGCAPAASTSRSCPASCRCRTSSRPRASPKRRGPACRNGSPTVSRALTMIRRRGGSSRRRSPPNRCFDLVDRGVRDFHFYTMNRADLVYAICHLLGRAAETRTKGRLNDPKSSMARRPARLSSMLRGRKSSCSTAPWAR